MKQICQILIAALLTTGHALAEDMTLCASKKSGAVRAIKTGNCKKSEELINTGGIKVYDATGQFLGDSIGAINKYHSSVYIPSLRAVAEIYQHDRQNPNIGDIKPSLGEYPTYYTSSDCSGQEYLSTDYSDRIMKKDGEYYVQRSGDLVFGKILGIRYSEGTCNSGEFDLSDYNLAYNPTPIKLPFSTPLALPLEFRD